MSEEVLDEAVAIGFGCVVPAAAVATAAFALAARLLPKRLAVVAAALALAAAFAEGNYLRETVSVRLEKDNPLTPGDLGRAAWRAIARPAPVEGDETAATPRLYWLPWAALLALIADVAVGWRRVPAWVA